MNEWLQSNWHLIALALALAIGGSVYRFSKWQRKVDIELKWLRESVSSIDANVSRILKALPTPK